MRGFYFLISRGLIFLLSLLRRPRLARRRVLGSSLLARAFPVQIVTELHEPNAADDQKEELYSHNEPVHFLFGRIRKRHERDEDPAHD